MIETLKTYGAVCAVESVLTVTFVVTAVLCAFSEAIAGVVVSLLAAGAVVVVGVSRFRALTAEKPAAYAPETVPFSAPKRNRAKPAPAKARKVTKRAKPKTRK